MNVVILPEALLDLRESEDFYDKQEAGLGVIYRESILADLKRLETLGGIHRRYGEFHWMICTRFQSFIFYQMETECVRVHTIIDARMDPNFIAKHVSG